MTGAAPLLPPAPPIGRQALALGVALGLHVAAALAWGDGLAGRASAAAGGVHGGSAQPAPAVVWLALPPAAAPDRPAEPEPPAEPAPAATAPEPPATPSDDVPGAPGGPTGAAGQFTKHGEPWTLAFPDIELGAQRRALMLALRLDAARRVEGVEPAGPASGSAPVELATYVGDQLLGAELQGGGAPGGTACLEVLFDAVEARVVWRLREPVHGRQRCPRPDRA